MAFGGKLLRKTRTMVQGTHKQFAYNDEWLDSIDISYDGELTPEVQQAIAAAFLASKERQQAQSSFGRLRWASPDQVSHVDVEKRQLIIKCSVSICD